MTPARLRSRPDPDAPRQAPRPSSLSRQASAPPRRMAPGSAAQRGGQRVSPVGCAEWECHLPLPGADANAVLACMDQTAGHDQTDRAGLGTSADRATPYRAFAVIDLDLGRRLDGLRQMKHQSE